MIPGNQRTSANRRLAWLISLLFFVSLTALFCRQAVQRAVLLQSFLRAQAPPESAFRELVEGTREPFVVLKRVWDTQKIPHRALVAAYLKENAGAHPELYRRAESLLLSAAMDVDGSVRELALATLTQQKHPAVPRLAAESLRDADPQIRLLGIQNLRRHGAAIALAPVFSLLDDPDLRVVTMSDSALRSWTGVDFGRPISPPRNPPSTRLISRLSGTVCASGKRGGRPIATITQQTVFRRQRNGWPPGACLWPIFNCGI